MLMPIPHSAAQIEPRLTALTTEIETGFSGVQKDFYEREFQFFHQLTNVSAKMR